MRIGILVPTTKGPIRVAGLRSVPGLPLSQIVEVDEHLPDDALTARYNSLVAKGGPVDALLRLPDGGHVLTLTGMPETGRSWELPAALAHWVLARGHSLVSDTADLLVWATGALDAQGSVPLMDYHLTSKIDRSSETLGAAVRAGTRVLLLRPPETGEAAPTPANFCSADVRELKDAITVLDATCADMLGGASSGSGQHRSLGIMLTAVGLTLAGGLALSYSLPLRSVPEMTKADGATAIADTEQARSDLDQASAKLAQDTVTADASDAEDTRSSKRVVDTETDIARAATPPPLTLIERRAPDGGACRDVLFGATEPRRITQRPSQDGFAPSPLPGLCALTLRWDGKAPAQIDLPHSLSLRLLRTDSVSRQRIAPGETLTLRLIDDVRPTEPYRFEVESDGTTAIVSHRLVSEDSND